MTKIDKELVEARLDIREIQTTLNESMKKDMQGMQTSMTALTEGITDLKIEIKTKSQWQNLWQSGTQTSPMNYSCAMLVIFNFTTIVIAIMLGIGGIGLYKRYT